MSLLWYGYEHVADFIIIAPYRKGCIKQAKLFDHVAVTVDRPVTCSNIEEATKIIIKQLKKIGRRE